MSKKEQPTPTEAGKASYEAWRRELHQSLGYADVYAEEAVKSELWLQLVEARQKAGLTQQQMAERIGVSQSQVARIEKQGYDAYTLTTLRRYMAALGDGFSLEVKIYTPEEQIEVQPEPHPQHSS